MYRWRKALIKGAEHSKTTFAGKHWRLRWKPENATSISDLTRAVPLQSWGLGGRGLFFLLPLATLLWGTFPISASTLRAPLRSPPWPPSLQGPLLYVTGGDDIHPLEMPPYLTGVLYAYPRSLCETASTLGDSSPVSRVLFSSGPTASPQNSSDRHQSSTGQSPQTRTAPQQSKSPVSQTTEQPPISPNPSALSRQGAPPSDLTTQAGAHLAHLTQFSPRSLTHTHPSLHKLVSLKNCTSGFSLLSHLIKCLHSFDCM